MNKDTIIIIASGLSLVSLIVSAWLAWRYNKLDRIRKEFFASGLKKDFEQILVDQNRALTKISHELQEQDESLTRLYKDNRSNIQKVGFVRFNPFDDAGGNISFSLALLNAKDDGVIISSLHGREGTRMYAKSVTNGISESKLTEEEEQAIKEAN